MSVVTEYRNRYQYLDVPSFVRESNRIEGLEGAEPEEVAATVRFLGLDCLSIDDVAKLVSSLRSPGVLRYRRGLNVRVGSHVAPPGGKGILLELVAILDAVQSGSMDPYEAHVAYETLHPFTDGNGRSGRALWAWHMAEYSEQTRRMLGLGFLHAFYYQALEHSR